MALFPFYLPAAVDEVPEVTQRTPFSLRGSVAPVVSSPDDLNRYAELLHRGTGPIAVDAERASGFTYSQRAYLIQIKREGSGIALIDPIPLGGLAPIAAATEGAEWIIHAATQDLECLREVGLTPQSLFDTELAGRLLGRERVGLAGLVESELGEYLEKGHGAADWSQRPLTSDMLTYAALDVELLIELRDSLEVSLREANKWDLAQQEFDALTRWQPKPPSGEAWRRTSGVHSIRAPRARGIVRELWITRDDIARRRDIAPGRILPDRSIIAAANARPTTSEKLRSLKEFNGRGAHKYLSQWWSAVERAYSLPESDLPGNPPRSEGPPPPKSWTDKNPAAFARLECVKSALAQLSEDMCIPVENIVLPDLIRRMCWEGWGSDVDARLSAGGARPWQRQLVSPILQSCRDAQPPDIPKQATPPEVNH